MEKSKELFPNLAAEMARANITKPELAKTIGIALGSMYSKTNGKTEFTLGEMQDIAKYLELKTEQKLTLDYLFSKGVE